MKYFLFIDESGNHDLSSYDPNFPVFTLCGVMISEPSYIILDSNISRIKKEFWGEKKIIFHSRDIRKCQKGFEILMDNHVKYDFYKSINALIQSTPFTIISANIQKEKFIKNYGKLEKVYSAALSSIIESTVLHLDTLPENNLIKLSVVVEKRGAKEDKELLDHYNKVRDKGTHYVDPIRISKYFNSFSYQSKKDNNQGLEFTDLLAYPIARFIIDRNVANPAFEVLKPKIFKSGDTLLGLKEFP